MDHQQAVESLAVERYLLSEMSPVEQDTFESHYFGCLACAADLRAAEEFLGYARELWAAEQRGQKVGAASAPKLSIWQSLTWIQPRLAVPAMAMLLVAAFAGGIASLRLRTRFSEVSAPAVLSATVLHTETRGPAPVIAATPGQPTLLQFDLPETPQVALQFVIRSSDGNVALKLPGGTYQAGERISLIIPRIELAPGRYNLSVEESASSARNRPAFAIYPIEVKYSSGDK